MQTNEKKKLMYIMSIISIIAVLDQDVTVTINASEAI